MRAAPQQASIRRDRLISLDMGEVAQELAQEKERARPGGSTPMALSGGAAAAVERLARCAASCRFACTCCIGALHSLAPPTLAAAEAACMLAVYLAAVPNAFPTRTSRVHYTFAGSAEDVVALSLLRCAAVTLAYCLGTGPLFQRPYLLTAALLCCVSLPLGLMKLVALVRHSQLPRRQWPPFIALFALHMAFAVLQVLAAQRIVTWARKRWEHGLGGLGLPWQEGEDAWLLAGQLQSQAEEGWRAQAGPEQQDLPADALADADSRWARCGMLRVHYKLALPLGCRGAPPDTGLVLVHSFGGGVFAWRHVMQPLADACRLAVLAFDRPGFGLTDRPAVAPGAPLDDNPYSLKSQALLALQLASSVGLRRVVLAGHGDGALLALMSAAMAARGAALSSSSAQSPAPLGSGGQLAMPAAAPLASDAAAGHHRQLSGGSVPDSLDWAWMGSQPDGGRSSVLQHLLRGEWPVSIEPRSGASGSALLSGWAGGRSPLRPPRPPGRRSAEHWQPRLLQAHAEEEGLEEGGQEELEGHHPEEQGMQLEEEEQAGQSGAAPRPKQLAQQALQGAGSSSGETGGLPGFEGSLFDNPSFLSRPSTLASGGTEAADAPLHPRGSIGEGASMQLNPSFLSDPEASKRSSTDQPGELLAHQSSLIANPSFLSQTRDREQWEGGLYSSEGGAAPAAAGVPAPQHQRHWASPDRSGGEIAREDDALEHAHQAGQQAPSNQVLAAEDTRQDAATERGSGVEGTWRPPEPAGLILLHPDSSGNVGPKYARVLAHSRLGRRVLRSLLRTEVGEVTNRRAWADPHRLTPGLLALYRRPLSIEGWDLALTEVARVRNEIHSLERRQLLGAVVQAGLPVLVATGESDHVTPPGAAARLAERLGAAGPRLAVLPACGHLSHEEAPQVLLDFLQSFLLEQGLGRLPR